jgi:predicted Ser/Thr protein kinase
MARTLFFLVCYLYIAAVYSQVTIEKTRLSSPRTAVSSIQSENKIYFVGGFEYHDDIATNKIEIFNTINNTWEEPIKLPTTGRGFVSPAKSGPNLYFVGGVAYENCTKIYSSETHSYEWIGCGPTLRTTKQLSFHNNVLTALGSFSADFYNTLTHTWNNSAVLTSWMQNLYSEISFVHEDLVVGVGGVNRTTLDLFHGAWIFNSSTNEISVFDAIVINDTSVDFNFTVMHNTVAVWSADWCLLHRLGSSEWFEEKINGIKSVLTLGYETFIITSGGFTVFDWTSGASNTTTNTDQILHAFSVSDQIVLITSDRMAIYDGNWSYLTVPKMYIIAPYFGQYILMDGLNFHVYNPATKSTTQQTGAFLSVVSIVAVDSTTFTAFTKGGDRIIFEDGTATNYGAYEPIFVGQFAIGRDIIDLNNLRVWINMTDTVAYNGTPILSSKDGRAISLQPQVVPYWQIDVYNYVTNKWLPSIPFTLAYFRTSFLRAFVVEDMMILAPKGPTMSFLNMTSGQTINVSGAVLSISATSPEIPVRNNVGYVFQNAQTVLQVTPNNFIRISNGQTELYPYQTYAESNAIYVSAYSMSEVNTFYIIFSYDIVQQYWTSYVLPTTQKWLYFAVSNNILLTFGGDNQLTYTGTLAAPDWQSIPFTLEYNPIIMSTLPDGRVMIAAGSHRTYGFFTEEVMFMNTTGLLATISYPLPSKTDPTVVPSGDNEEALTSGEMVAAIVVPIGFALIAAAILIVLLRRWKNRRRQGSALTSVGLATKYGNWFTPFEQLVFEEQLGQGGSGQVFKGKWKSTVVALKVSMTEANSSVISELELMMQMRPHPNVVQLFGFSIHPETDSIVLIIEYCNGGSLQAALESDEISSTQKRQWILGVANGLAHLHSHKIVHRDLAARNIMLSHNEPKLTDFGMSRLVEEQNLHGTTKSELGPIRWMAPESLRNKEYSTKSGKTGFFRS